MFGVVGHASGRLGSIDRDFGMMGIYEANIFRTLANVDSG